MQPTNINRNFFSSDKFKIIVVIIFLGILLIILGFLVGTLLRQGHFEIFLPTPSAQATPTAPLPVAVPTIFARTDCKSATLLLGGTTFQIENLPRRSGGSLSVPGDTSGIAYEIVGTEASPVFILSPSPQNISAMATISVGSPAVVTRLDCSATTYSLSAPQASAFSDSILRNGSAQEITIFFPTASSETGFTFKGKRVTEPVAAVNQSTLNVPSTLPASATNAVSTSVENRIAPTFVRPVESTFTPTAENVISTSEALIPTPNYDEILAEVGLLDTSRSFLGINITISVSVYNFGTIPITLSENDIALTQSDGTPVRLKSSKPSLPNVIQPGETKTFEFTFKTPGTSTATLRVLSVEYDIGGY